MNSKRQKEGKFGHVVYKFTFTVCLRGHCTFIVVLVSNSCSIEALTFVTSVRSIILRRVENWRTRKTDLLSLSMGRNHQTLPTPGLCDDRICTNRGLKRKENSSDFGVRITRGKLSRNSLGKRERNSSLFQGTGSATTGNRIGLKLGLQQFNLQLVNVTCTSTQIRNVKSCKHIVKIQKFKTKPEN